MGKSEAEIKAEKKEVITGKNFYKAVADANEGVRESDVRSMFIWYDLLSCLLPFQIIFILIFAIGGKYYSLTICSLFFILINDTIIKVILEKDMKTYPKFEKHLSLVKLWVVPLAVMASVTTFCLLAVGFNLI